ncbi:S1 RNA-binding domain-containing protein [Chloroflexi bacterium]|nr:S1 RNA-binding domain-containing protein [Chloroflexota bacterium]
MNRGQVLSGKVMELNYEGVLINLGGKSEGLIPKSEMRYIEQEKLDNLKVGDELIVMVLKTGFSRGSDVTPIYSYDKALVREGWDILEKAQNNNEPVEGIILGSNKGGAMIDIKGVQGFIPSSQLMSFFVPDENVEDSSVEIDVTGRKNLEKNVNSKISVKVLEVDQTRNRAILSERALMQELKDKAKQKVMTDLVEGQIVKAKIIGLSSFGAFVDINGADGLIHISELSWNKLNSPSEVVEVGQELDVYILNLDRENKRIALSIKRLTPGPWDEISKNMPVGTKVKAVVTRIVEFGVFARINDMGVEGLIHISELSDTPDVNPADIVKVDEELEVTVVSLDPERRRLGLSLKNDPLSKKAEAVEEPAAEAAEEPAAEAAEEPEAEEK